jgi:hypothetical protein
MIHIRPVPAPLATAALAVLAASLVPPGLSAQGGAGTEMAIRQWNPSHEAAPRALAVRSADAIQVDGRLDEATWASAPPMTEFIQVEPQEGVEVTERTEVRVLYDDQALYIGARLHDREPLTTRLARRDAMVPDSDFFVVYLDSYHDHETAYRFATNPSGMKRDEIVSGGRDMGDNSWDPVWDVATSIDEEGWMVEMRIPFSQLRFSRDDEQVWGIQVERKINRNQERALFSFTPRTERGGVARYGHLEGIRGIRPGRRLELLPYVGGRAEFRDVTSAGGPGETNPFRTGSDYFGNAGVDLKFRITSNVTLDATANPDFGQVEVDPAVLNLTAFETQFDEKRPFFVEGSEIFSFGEGGPVGSTGRGPQLLYSRRVGRAPQGEAPGTALFADAPGTTTILGAAKLTGKMGDGWSVGLLEAVTGREEARWLDDAGARGTTTVEPLTNYAIGRLRRDFLGGRTRFGLIATAVNRELAGDPLRDRLRSSAYSAGVEFRHDSPNRTWRFSSSFSPSLVQGSPGAIARTQRSSSRYYQRPDAGHLDFDPGATSLSGYYAMVDLNKQAGKYQAKLALAGASPGYEVNDLGFQTAADRFIMDTNFMIQETRPGAVFRRWDVRGGPDGVWNYGGQRVFAEFNVFGSYQLLNYWGGGGRIAYNPETFDDRLTRGGPLSREPARWSGNVSLNSDNRKTATVRGSFNWATDDAGSWRNGVELNVTWKPSDNWELRLGPSLSRSFAVAQYVAAVADSLATETFGSRYVFAGLDQSTLGVETRVNITFSPTISFEMYAQPFMASGDYRAPKELAAPRTFAFRTYGEDAGTVTRAEDGRFRVDPDGDGPAVPFAIRDLDFNVRSLIGNAVFRWEWRPGSTLFLVWQQSRADRLAYGSPLDGRDPVGTFRPWQDTRDLLTMKGDNIFLVKVNYWLNP